MRKPMNQFEYLSGYGSKDISKLLDDTIKPNDKARLLINLFSWADTPQGFNFWDDEYAKLFNGGDFSHEALMSLTVEYEKTHEPI